MSDNNKKSKILKIIPKTASSEQAANANPEIIAKLERMLALAKSGELTHIITVSMVNGQIYDGWNYPEEDENCSPFTMLGAMHSLTFDLTNLTIERREQ